MTSSKPRPPLLSRRARWLLAAIIAVLLGMTAYKSWLRPIFVVGGGRPDGWWAARVKAKTYATIPARDEIGFERLSDNYPSGGWLTTFEEFPQSLETYQRNRPNRPTAKRRNIVLQPIGTFNAREEKLLQSLREYSEIFFQLPARLEKPLPLALADGWKRQKGGRTQYDAGKMIDRVLRPRRPDDAAAYLGITMADLWSGELSYVFGVGDTGSRTGIYSLVRYFPSFWHKQARAGDEQLILRRACQVLTHETGHIFGISHCVFYRCSMNGANSLLESDAAPLHYCPVDHRKLRWNIGFDADKRYRELRAFYGKHGLEGEAKWLDERIKNWRRVQSP